MFLFLVFETWWEQRGVLARLPVLHHDAAAQPALPAGDLGQGDAGEFHDHAARPGGPAARHRRRQGKARAGGEEERADPRERCQQETGKHIERGTASERYIEKYSISSERKGRMMSAANKKQVNI